MPVFSKPEYARESWWSLLLPASGGCSKVVHQCLFQEVALSANVFVFFWCVCMMASRVGLLKAGTIALVVTRKGELDKGVPVNDATGVSHGNSHAAAKEGLSKCGLARVIWNIPVLLIPPPLMQVLSNTKFFKANPRLNLPLYTLISTVAVVVGIYPAQAIFPQYDSIPVERLEPQFQGLKTAAGDPIDRFYYNKGL